MQQGFDVSYACSRVTRLCLEFQLAGQVFVDEALVVGAQGVDIGNGVRLGIQVKLAMERKTNKIENW